MLRDLAHPPPLHDWDRQEETRTDLAAVVAFPLQGAKLLFLAVDGIELLLCLVLFLLILLDLWLESLEDFLLRHCGRQSYHPSDICQTSAYKFAKNMGLS
jgi:hypothetical protein